MKPHVSEIRDTVLPGDCVQVMRRLGTESVDCLSAELRIYSIQPLGEPPN